MHGERGRGCTFLLEKKYINKKKIKMITNHVQEGKGGGKGKIFTEGEDPL